MDKKTNKMLLMTYLCKNILKGPTYSIRLDQPKNQPWERTNRGYTLTSNFQKRSQSAITSHLLRYSLETCREDLLTQICRRIEICYLNTVQLSNESQTPSILLHRLHEEGQPDLLQGGNILDPMEITQRQLARHQ